MLKVQTMQQAFGVKMFTWVLTTHYLQQVLVVSFFVLPLCFCFFTQRCWLSDSMQLTEAIAKWLALFYRQYIHERTSSVSQVLMGRARDGILFPWQQPWHFEPFFMKYWSLNLASFLCTVIVNVEDGVGFFTPTETPKKIGGLGETPNQAKEFQPGSLLVPLYISFLFHYFFDFFEFLSHLAFIMDSISSLLFFPSSSSQSAILAWLVLLYSYTLPVMLLPFLLHISRHPRHNVVESALCLLWTTTFSGVTQSLYTVYIQYTSLMLLSEQVSSLFNTASPGWLRLTVQLKIATAAQRRNYQCILGYDYIIFPYFVLLWTL